MNAKPETLGTSKTRCACHAYEIESWIGEVPEDGDPNDYVQYEGTGCTQYTERIFAPGHDAKLKSLLIKAGAAGLEVVLHDGGVNSHASAEHFAKGLGFEHQVLAGIKRALAKEMARAEKKSAKAQKAMAAQTSKEIAKRAAADAKIKKAQAAAKQSRAPRTQQQQVAEKALETPPYTIKVGRWTYQAVIDQKGNATYQTSGGQTKTVKKSGYKLVPETA